MVLVLLEALLGAGVLVVVEAALPEVDGVGERSEADE